MNVAIVGRPNVGKSTLFNRIIKKRIAITLKEPGTTRDRISAETEWNYTKLTLIDTGGFITEKELAGSELTEKVNFQIRQAINSADVIIFLVDGSMSPLPQDFAIADILRKSNKPFILAVNKIDKKDTKEYLNEFYRLGAKELVQISAEHGIDVDEVLDAVVKNLPPGHKDSEQESLVRLLIIGRPNVGKSLFFNRILNEERVIVSEQPGTTRDAIEEEFIFEDKKFKIIDTAGLRKKPKVKESVEYYSVQRAIQFISEADIIILLLDATNQLDPPLPITNQDKHIIQLVLNRGKGVVIAINKVDLIPAKNRNYLILNTKIALGNITFLPIVLTSALKNKGIIEVIKKALDVYKTGSKKISDELIEMTVTPRLLQNLPSHHIRYLNLRQIGVLPPKFELTTNVTKDVDESYKRFVANEIRNYFSFFGNPIRVTVKSKS